ncbi:hypothetical protein CC85DRAFT_328157 [Cutaneotrichosporon oleaginosum]|uniref:Uncharacterized protein n=1 Tax=Cutaneotrichosporon oleaginosum TaxID=879819 RepID=A0A0J0XN75_9TREE|nr:uncharacterized protein CC85DRAFT_328157 [Cutaneotrichosporon oleaginosum]KLT42576.1 hypothetical protein CC85DRAFT_328157 [Cutaneotrichosporon oleaginosum]TXT15008.1 hypothetical protein COLE_01201 [Cutaneotrichosporon oleaginosum]
MGDAGTIRDTFVTIRDCFDVLSKCSPNPAILDMPVPPADTPAWGRALFGAVFTINDTCQSLKTDVAALKADVAALKTDIAGLKAQVARVELQTAQQRIDTSYERELITARIYNASGRVSDSPLAPLPTPPPRLNIDEPLPAILPVPGPPPEIFPRTRGELYALPNLTVTRLLAAYGLDEGGNTQVKRKRLARFIGCY